MGISFCICFSFLFLELIGSGVTRYCLCTNFTFFSMMITEAVENLCLAVNRMDC